MGRGSRRQKKASGSRKSKTDNQDAGFRADEDMDDEIDTFHKQRDVILLDINADAGGDLDDDMEQPVFDFKGVGEYDSEDNDGSGDDADSDDEDYDDDNAGGDDNGSGGGKLPRFEAKIARTKKYLNQRFGGVDDDMHDDDDVLEDERKAAWGRHKSTYFGADNVDIELSSDEDDLLVEEEEALRMQKEKAKSFSMEDFGLEDIDQDGLHLDGNEKSIEDILAVNKSSKKAYVDGATNLVMFENHVQIKKDLNALSKEEQMDVVYSSAPELVGLLAELNDAVDHLKKVKQLLCKMKERKNVTEGALHFWDVKQHLLLAYCQAIGFYLLLKSEGHPVRDHPVIARLVEIKNMLEKVKKIDENIPAEIEESVKQDDGSELTKREPKEALGSKLQSDITKTTAKVEEVAELGKEGKIYDLRGTQERDQDDQVGLQSKEMLKVRASLEQKLKQKGIFNYMKQGTDKSRNHALQQVNKRIGTLADFDDEVSEPAVNNGTTTGHFNSLRHAKLSQLVATKSNKHMLVSGDDDLPKRDDIGERRRKHELRVLARIGAGSMDDDNVAGEYGAAGDDYLDSDHQDGQEAMESEDEYYKEAKRKRASKLSVKADLNPRTQNTESLAEIEADGKRLITYQIEKNKGLTRSRNKRLKNPRVKYKSKHSKAVVRRKGQVRDIRKPSGPYGGETTGINVGVSRSVRFKN